MNAPKEIKVNVMGEVVIVLDYGGGRLVAKPGGGSPDSDQGKLRHLAEAHAVELLAAAYKRGPKVRANRKNAEVMSENSEAWKRKVTDWVDKHLRQRTYKTRPNYSELARRLLRTNSDFEWPEGIKPVRFDEVRKVISAHLKAQKNP